MSPPQSSDTITAEEPSEAIVEALFLHDAVIARVVPIPGARNLRDMGGYPAADGRRIKRGMLFRGGHPGDIPAESVPELYGLGLRGHVDLRSNSERATIAFPTDFIAAAGSWAHDYEHSGGDLLTILSDPAGTGEAMRLRMIELYRRFPEEQHAGIAATFRLLLGGQVPFLVNCTAGKDRTGVACALLLSALGVPREIVRRDYALTETLHDPADKLFRSNTQHAVVRAETNRDVWHAMMRSDPAYIDATFEELDRKHGGLEPYLASAFGIGAPELARLRELLLED